MISVEEAVSRIFSVLPPAECEVVQLSEAHGRIVTRPVRALVDLPPFDNSAMDGYAVRAEDVREASEERPAVLTVIGRIGAGQEFKGTVRQKTAVRLFTGSIMPQGADAVVMQEDTRDERDNVLVMDPVRPLENIRMRGEDLKAGSCILIEGERLNAARVGLLGACGVPSVEVARAPQVTLLATGNELRTAGEVLAEGQIYESNRLMLAGLLSEIGIPSRVAPLVPDTLLGTQRALEEAFSNADVVITTGGVSVGEFDFVKEAFTTLGGQIDFWKIAMRPGKPFVFGKFGKKLLFGLPGNPVSAFVTFMILVRPALLKVCGAVDTGLVSVPAVLTEDLVNRGDRRHFMRVRVERGEARRAGVQASHMIASLGEANGLVDVPPGARLEAGQAVVAQVWALA